MRIKIKQAHLSNEALKGITVSGWVRTRRDAKDFSFIEINDGSCIKNLQVIVDSTSVGAEFLSDAITGSAVSIIGDLIESQGKGQKWEFKSETFRLLGRSDSTFPLQKKGHTVEFLRSIPHLRARTNRLGSMMRIRSRMAIAVHDFFQKRGFMYVHTPIITTSDCEGAGEQFCVTTLNPAEIQKLSDGQVDWSADFFKKPAYLTVSGQLEGEALACALGDVYTFGPTFRAENSNTSRHASEFWMVEPEMAFCDLFGNILCAEELVQHLVKVALEDCKEELEFYNSYVDHGLLERLSFVAQRPFVRISYTEAIEILLKSCHKFNHPVVWGDNFQSEHERFLTEEIYKCPVTVFDYPKCAKPFYMRQNDDGKTVAAMDVLVPRIGEIVGGSQREERYDMLISSIQQHDMSVSEYGWYIDTRRYGSVPHSGFGLGFERLLMFVTGEGNIRDVIAFPRTPGHG